MERDTIEARTAENAYLRGLLALPIGGLMLLSAFGNWRLGPLDRTWVFLACALATGASWLPLKRYYDRHYGRVTPSASQQRRALVAIVVGLPLMVGGSLLLSSRESWSLDLPVNTTAISFALVLLVSLAMSVGLRTHHKVIFGALLLTGLLPVWERGGMSGNGGLALASAAVVAAGVLDHRLLVRTFGPADRQGAGGVDARA